VTLVARQVGASLLASKIGLLCGPRMMSSCGIQPRVHGPVDVMRLDRHDPPEAKGILGLITCDEHDFA